MFADPIPQLGSWLLTYLLHSTLLLGAVWLLTRRWIHAPAMRDILWKTALVGGLVTATMQTFMAFEPWGGAMAIRLGSPSLPGRGIAAPKVALSSATRRLGGSAEAPKSEWSGTLMPTSAPSATPEVQAVEERVGVTPNSEPQVTPEPVGVSPTVVTAPVADGPLVSARGWILPAILGGWALLGGALATLYLIQRRRAMRRIGPRVPVSSPVLQRMLDGLCEAGAVRPAIRLTSAPGLASPVALGHDEIVLPHAALTELSPDQQRSMLAHELAHLARRDPAWLAFSCLMERALFLQPLNRIARIRLQEAAEYLCDDWAVTRTGSGVSLATCLVKVAEWVHTPPHPIPLAGMAEHRSQLVTRIHRLIEGRTMPSAPRSLWFMAGAVALVGFTAVAAPGITASNAELLAQDTTRAAVQSSDTSETSESSARHLMRLLHLNESRARRAARLDARAMAMLPPTAPMPPAPARAPRAPGWFGGAPLPALAPVAAHLDALRAKLVKMDGGERRRDTSGIAVPALISALKDGDVEVRRAAAQSLSNLEDPRAVPAFIEALRDSDAQVRAAAACGLGQLEDKRAVTPLVGLLKDADKDVRRSAMSALSSLSADVPVEVVVSALGEKDPEIREAALGLAERHTDGDDEEKPWDPRIVQAVIGLIGDPNADVRGQAISLVGEMHLTQAPAGLLTAAKDKDPDVRQHVASSLGEIGDPKSVPVLREMLADGNSDVREQAVQALSEVRDRSALEALVGALKSSDPVVRRSAAEALGQRDEDEKE